MVNPIGRQPIPEPQIAQQRLEQRPTEPAEALPLRVTVKIPDKASGRQTVAYVHGIHAGDDAVAETTLVAHHKIIPGKVETFKGQWLHLF